MSSLCTTHDDELEKILILGALNINIDVDKVRCIRSNRNPQTLKYTYDPITLKRSKNPVGPYLTIDFDIRVRNPYKGNRFLSRQKKNKYFIEYNYVHNLINAKFNNLTNPEKINFLRICYKYPKEFLNESKEDKEIHNNKNQEGNSNS